MVPGMAGAYRAPVPGSDCDTVLNIGQLSGLGSLADGLQGVLPVVKD